MKNWKTTLFGVVALLLPLLAYTGFITKEIAEAMLTLCIAFGFISSADAKKTKDKIDNRQIWTVLLICGLPILFSSCAVLRQADYDQIAQSFSEKAIRQIYKQPNFTFSQDSINLSKEVPYSIIEKVLGKSLTPKFTSEGESSLKTEAVFIQIKWAYIADRKNVLLTFIRVKWKT
jgi:hypothetical protein